MKALNPSTLLNGWIVVDKSKGVSSAGVVNQVKKIVKVKKVGHAGTLDPLATGVLPLALGEATKTINFLFLNRKVYTFVVRWGEKRDTDDAMGKIERVTQTRPTKNQIVAELPHFIGKISQIPPDFSAIKVSGTRAYKLAREKKDYTLKARPVEVHDFQLLKIINENKAEFQVVCGKGTYIRSLVRDLAEQLNTMGHVVELRRNTLGFFDEKDAISLDKLKDLVQTTPVKELIWPVHAPLDDIPAIALTIEERNRLKNGQVLDGSSIHQRSGFGSLEPGRVMLATCQDHLVALVRFEGESIRPFRVLNI